MQSAMLVACSEYASACPLLVQMLVREEPPCVAGSCTLTSSTLLVYETPSHVSSRVLDNHHRSAHYHIWTGMAAAIAACFTKSMNSSVCMPQEQNSQLKENSTIVWMVHQICMVRMQSADLCMLESTLAWAAPACALAYVYICVPGGTTCKRINIQLMLPLQPTATTVSWIVRPSNRILTSLSSCVPSSHQATRILSNSSVPQVQGAGA